MKENAQWRTLVLLAAFAATLTASFGGGAVIEATSAGLSLDSRTGDLRLVGIDKFNSNEARGMCIIVR